MNRYGKIFLVGFMGSGKSTAGKKLAARLGWSFIDLDERIESSTGMKINEIFHKRGEKSFRETETDQLHRLEKIKNAVISTGGGTPCFNGNMDFMLTTGLTVYLCLTPVQLKSRLETSGSERPLIRDLGKEDLLNYIIKTLEEREKWYLKADIVVDGAVADDTLLFSAVSKLIRD